MRRPSRLCLVPGCRSYARPGSEYCREHARASDRARPSPPRRGYDKAWHKVRAAYLAAHPYCEWCGRPATQVHHLLPIRAGGRHDWSNLQALCASCHSRITARGGG